ncbi:MAG: response regulator [Clostridiales bacterium]|jgi:putative two-component system response regulator|nr:response regulator [Clostridiales bacterium]
MAKPKIMLVDDNITNLSVGKNVLSDKYEVFTIPSGEKLLKILGKITPDLILLDIDMPDMNGYDIIKILKENKDTVSIPVIFLTGQSDTESELEGLSRGAIDYIIKPFSPPLLLKRLEAHLLIEEQKRELKNFNDNLQNMVDAKTKTVYELQSAVLETVAELVESRDDITGGHISRTQSYLYELIHGMICEKVYIDDMKHWDVDRVIQSAQLHDVGKIYISDLVLNKPGKLTDEEFEIMKSHAAKGVEAIEKIEMNTTEKEFLRHAKLFAGTHHEKWNGTGYPYKLKEFDIPLQGRAMAVADVYDALVSERPYKKGFPHEKAVDIIVEGRGSHFDPLIVDVFVKVADKFRGVGEAFRLEQERLTAEMESEKKAKAGDIVPVWIYEATGKKPPVA